MPRTLGVHHSRARLRRYDPRWASQFARVRRRILSLIGPFVADIQHVGSTSIPNMPSKPILDVMVLLHHQRLARRAARILCAHGYIDRRRFDVVNDRWMVARGQPVRTQHVSLAWPGSRTWENYIIFRDWLLIHEKDARRYATLKRSLAKRYPLDARSYTAGKTRFIFSILDRARKPH